MASLTKPAVRRSAKSEAQQWQERLLAAKTERKFNEVLIGMNEAGQFRGPDGLEENKPMTYQWVFKDNTGIHLLAHAVFMGIALVQRSGKRIKAQRAYRLPLQVIVTYDQEWPE